MELAEDLRDAGALYAKYMTKALAMVRRLERNNWSVGLFCELKLPDVRQGFAQEADKAILFGGK